MIYDYVVTKPPLDEMYEDVIQHFNPFHDKRNGQFTFKNGVSSVRTDKLRRKAEKATAKAAKANKKAAQAGNSLLHPFKAKRKDKLQTKAFKAQYKADKLNAKLSKSENKDSKTIGKLQNEITDATMKGDNKALENALKKLSGADFDGNKPTSKQIKEKINKEVEYARKSGMYNMEFLERNLDLDPVTEEQMTGKDLDNAYRKFLIEEEQKKIINKNKPSK